MIQWLFNLLRSPYDPAHYYRSHKKYKRQIRINKIVDLFDPLSVRNLSKLEEFQAPPFKRFKPLGDWFNDNPST